MTGPAVQPPNPQADAWDAYTQAGMDPDSATALIKSNPSQADAWDRMTAQGLHPDVATALVKTHVPSATPPPSAWDSGIVHAGDAATFGLLPKAVAGVMHLTTGRPYDNLLAAGKQVMGQEQTAHPYASGAGTVAGAVLNPANLLIPGVGEGATVPKIALAGAKAGGILGAADAAGHSSGSLQDRLTQTGQGAAGGALGGGVLGGLGGAIAPAVSARMRVAQTIAASGMDKVKAALAALEGSGRGDVVSLADLSPELSKLADQSATRSAVANKTLSDMTSARQASQGDRVLGDFRDALAARPGPTTPARGAPEPWQMTRDAFNQQAWYHGADDATLRQLAAQGDMRGSSGYVTLDPKKAAQFPMHQPPGGVAVIMGNRDPLGELAHPDIRVDAAAGPEQARTLTSVDVVNGKPVSALERAKVAATIPRSAATDPHAYLVARAVADGKPVPQAVRAEYPSITGGYTRAEPNAPALSDELDQARREWAASPAGFGGLRDQNPSIDISGLRASLRHPAIQSALDKARLAGDLKPGDDVASLLQRIQADNPNWSPAAVQRFANSGPGSLYGAGGRQGPRPISYGDVQALSQELDARATKAFKTPGGGNLGASLAEIRDAIEGTLAKVPGHSDIMAEYGDRSQGIKALAQGEQAWTRQDARQIGPELAALSPQNADLYREGLASKAIAELNSKGSNRDVAAELTKMSPATKAKVTAAFGDPQTAQAFIQRQQAERMLSQMKGATTGSQTAGRMLSAKYGPLGFGGSILGAALTGHPQVAAGLGVAGLGAAGAQALEQHVAAKTGSLLSTQGAPQIRALLEALQQPGRVGTGLQSAAAGASGLAGSQVPGLFGQR